MIPFITNLFATITHKRKREWYNTLINVIKLRDTLATVKTQLDTETAAFIQDNAKDLYVSMHDLAHIPDGITLHELYKKAKHVNEFSINNSSSMEVYACIEGDHVVLCPDKAECDAHRDTSAEKIKIVMVR